MAQSNLTKQIKEHRVIILVAIGVIAVAGIGAVVLGGGDATQDTGPNASFEATEEMETWNEQGTAPYVNAPQASVTLASGDELGIANTRFLLDGVASTWGLRDGEVTKIDDRRVYVQPTPDMCQTIGTNERATIEAGQSEHVMFATSGSYDGNLQTPFGNADGFPALPTHNKLGDTDICSNNVGTRRTDGPMMAVASSTGEGGSFSGNRVNTWGFTHLPTKGSTLRLVWKASSGGETQELFTHEFQNDPESPSVGE